MLEIFTPEGFAAFLQVVMIDLVLAGDNAIVIGMAAAGLPAVQRNNAILIGIIAATVLRILFASVTTYLLQIVGLLLAGGILLLWVCWKLWRELRNPSHDPEIATPGTDNEQVNPDGSVQAGVKHKTFAQAAGQIVLADVSMSLDNVLAVAGAARDHPTILIFGLALSVMLMGLAATFVSRLLQNHRWIAYVGLAIILYVAFEMIYRGSFEVMPYMIAT